MHLGPRARLAFLASIAAATVLCGPTAAHAQQDPCLTALAGDTEALQRYDALVGQYLAASEAADYAAQVLALDQLWDICDVNLRLMVLRGDAHRTAGHCEAAAREYLWVLDNADTWPYLDNAADARTRAAAALDELRPQCVALVELTCVSPGTLVQVGDLPALSCPATVQVPAGSYPIRAAAPNRRSVTRDYDLRPGRAFVEIEALTPLERPGTVEFDCPIPGTRIVVGSERFDCPALRTFEQGVTTWLAYPPAGEPLEGTVDVREGESVRVDVPAEAPRVTGTLAVQCGQPDVTVTILGPDPASPIDAECPFSVELMPGNYTIAAAAPLHEPRSLPVRVDHARTTQLAVVLEKAAATTVILRALVGAGMMSGYVDYTPPAGDEAKPDTSGVAKLAVAFPFGADDYQMELEAHARAGIGDAFGVMGGAAVNWIFGTPEARLLFGFGGNYGTFGIPACPASTTCTVSEESATYAWGFDVALELLLSPRVGVTVAFDAYLPGGILVGDLLGGARLAF